MGKASSAKKIKRVQQAGVSRAPGQRRNLGYPALIGGIIVVGMVLVFFARGEREAQATEAPVANQDHWHAAFGIDICGQFQANVADFGPDAKGIHTHQDGLIHVHPFVGAAAGDKATFQVFADQIGLELDDGSFTLPDGTTYADGDPCTDEDGKETDGRVALYVWPPQATDATEPEVITEDLGATRFAQDGQAFVLAFAPKDAEPKLPPSLPELQAPSDMQDPSQEGSTDFTTTVPGATETTVAGDAAATTTITEGATETSTTVAGG
ncbi:MAG: hypothetical protein ACYC2O_10275 [Microthrixaceae bacterium]